MATNVVNAVKNTATVSTRYLLGLCLPTTKESATKIRIPRLVRDEYLNMYFREFEFVYAHDPNKLCKTGDTVLVRPLPERLTRLITHEVLEVIYTFGDIVDPVTGKKVVVSRYRDDLKAERETFGITEGFDYDKAPPRGRLEGIRDFTHKPMQVKFYEGQPDTAP